MSQFDNAAQGPIPLPQADEITKKEREDAMGAYFMTFATLGIGAPIPMLSLVVSFIYHQLNSKKSRFVAFHSLQSMLAEIPISISNAVVVVWGLVLLFGGGASRNFAEIDFAPFLISLLFTIIITIIYIIFSLIAAFRAQKGRFIYFWLIGPFVYRHYYVLGKGPRNRPQDNINLPPPGF